MLKYFQHNIKYIFYGTKGDKLFKNIGTIIFSSITEQSSMNTQDKAPLRMSTATKTAMHWKIPPGYICF